MINSHTLKRSLMTTGRFSTLSLGLISALLYSQLASATELVNLMTTQNGMHRISYEQLSQQGVDLNGLKHKRLSITSGNQRVAVRTVGGSGGGKFAAGAYLEFYAEQANSLYTEQRAYTLHYDAAKRLNITDKTNKKFSAKRGFATAYQHTQLVEDNLYYDYLAPSITDPWHYGQMVAFAAGDTAGTAVTFDVDQLAGGSVDMQVEVFGIVDIQSLGNDHHVVVKVNGSEVGDQQFDGNVAQTITVANVPMNVGSNQAQLFLRSIASTPFDAVGLNKIRLNYLRNTVAENNFLEGRFSAQQVQVSNIASGEAVSLYRRNDDQSMQRLKRFKRSGDTVSFNTDGVAADYIVVADSAFKQPTVAMIHDQDAIKTGQAEYLIITNSAFVGSELDQFVQIRQADYAVKVVDVEQIYAQFGDHVPSADAIHAYVKYAVANLGTEYVTLVGSDTYDYKKYVSQSISYVPTKYAQTPGGLLFIRQTPSDASYGDVDDDGIPDIPVGRLSVRTPAELALVVEKIRDYQAREGYAGRILIAADKEDAGNGVSFTDDLTALVAAIPSDWAGALRSDFRAIPDVDGDALARQKVLNAINAGVSVAAYIGHSSQQQWSRTTPALFKTSDIAGLNNIDKPTLVTQWGCWNTYFVDPDGNSMADLFLVGGANGAVTVLGASTLTTAAGERILGVELNKRMYNRGVTIGKAVIDAKRALALKDPSASDILLGWQIIGDPALVVNPNRF